MHLTATDPDRELEADAADRRAALTAATAIVTASGRAEGVAREWWLDIAAAAYAWLRARDTIRLASVAITPGTPRPEGTPDMATPFDLSDTDEVTFSLSGLDAKGASAPLPAGFTAAWTLADPASTGAVLTPSADGTTAVLAAGVPDTSLMVSVTVTVTNPDGSTTTLTGAEAVVVQATAAATVGIVPGTPSPEQPAAPAAPGTPAA